jgi:hypothetical protein
VEASRGSKRNGAERHPERALPRFVRLAFSKAAAMNLPGAEFDAGVLPVRRHPVRRIGDLFHRRVVAGPVFFTGRRRRIFIVA